MNPGPARVLDSLRRAGGRSCSGEVLSESQGVSRGQVWKDVRTLRARGYTIEAEPGDGYRLVAVPDRLYPEEIALGLATRWLARDIHYFEETDSTNRAALDLARTGAAHGTTVIAEAQTAGRGRLGRTFFSPPGTNLYTSVLLRPKLTTAEAPAWILASAVAVAETVAEFVERPDAVEIKWPNDVLIERRKVAGILVEARPDAGWAVIGIGVNVSTTDADLPPDVRGSATSLAQASPPAPAVEAMLATVLQALARRLSDPHEWVLEAWRSRDLLRGERVRWRDGEGLAGGIDEAGRLLVEQRAGIAALDAGEVHLLAGPG